MLHMYKYHDNRAAIYFFQTLIVYYILYDVWSIVHFFKNWILGHITFIFNYDSLSMREVFSQPEN